MFDSNALAGGGAAFQEGQNQFQEGQIQFWRDGAVFPLALKNPVIHLRIYTELHWNTLIEHTLAPKYSNRTVSSNSS